MNFTEQLPPQRTAEFANSVHRFVQLQAQKARLDAEILEVLGDISVVIDEAVDSGPQDSRIMDQAQRALCLEVGAPARMHEQAILTMVNNARPFVRDFPKTLQALAAAEISQRHAFIIADIAGGLLTTDAQRAIYESEILPKAKTKTTNQLREAARRIAHRLSEKTIDQRHQEKAATRDVWVYDTGDGMANLVAHLPATIAYAIRDRLGQMALAADPTGRKISQLRTDIFTDLLLTGHTAAHHPRPTPNSTADCGVFGEGGISTDGEHGTCKHGIGEHGLGELGAEGALFSTTGATADCPDCVATNGSRGLGAITAQVSITIPLLALLPDEIADIIRQTPGFEHVGGLDGACELNGYGPIDTHTALFLAGTTSGWDRIMTHPITGTPLRTDRYTPSQEIKRMLRIRDQHCRFPACRISAPRCDNDHTIPWSRGGPTAIENLAALCRYHHVIKHEAGWKATQLDNGTIKWTTALGYTIITEPPSNEMHKAYPSTPTSDPGVPPF